MEQKASLTSLMSAFGRAYHAEHEADPIFADFKAKELMTPAEYRTIGGYLLGGMDFFAPEKKDSFASPEEAMLYLVNTQISATPLARAAYCEEALRTACMTGTEQYVILGAGLDTFAFHEPSFRYPIFEVDHPATQADKRERIQRAGWEIPKNLVFVPVDFSKDDLMRFLSKYGFYPRKKTFFSWLGVSYYMAAGEIDAMIGSIASFAAEGSTLLFDYGDEHLLTSQVRRVQNMRAMAAAGGEPMHSCFSEQELERLLEHHGFLIYELLTSGDIQEKCFAGRDYTAFETINYCTAVLKRSAFCGKIQS